MIVARGLQAGHRLAKAATACLLCFACGSQSPSQPGTAGSGGSTGGAGAGGAGIGPGGAPSGGSSGSMATGGAGTGPFGGAGGGGAGGAGLSGGSGGTNATAGAAGAAGSVGPIVPAQVAGTSKYRFSSGDTILEIDAQTGARVSKLSLSGADLIVTSATDPTTWGSVFWTSPRIDVWMPEWPPPAAIDNSPYSATISGSHLMTTGTADTSLGVAMLKDYALDATSGWITINYTINATKAQKAAPWEVSRVPRGGITFFPLGSATSLLAGPLTVTKTDGIVWFDDASKTATSSDGSKLLADGMGGWEAYAFGGNLFLKRFADQPTSLQAPGEGEICIYPGASWLEFEVQGPYTQIAKDGSLAWKMQWRIVKIPSSVTVAVGSASLVTFVQQQLAL